MEYLFGLAVFGFVYWLLDGIRKDIQTISTTGDVLNLMLYFWGGLLVVYLIFGGWWLIRMYHERKYQRGEL